MTPRRNTEIGKFLDAVRIFGRSGATGEQIEVIAGIRHQTVGYITSRLLSRGEIVVAPFKRQTNSGRWARVYVATEEAYPSEQV